LLAGAASADHPRTEDLEVTLRLNDDSFCPGGRRWGREGRQEGRDDRISVFVHAKAAGRNRVRLRREVQAVVTVTGQGGEEVHRWSFPISGSFGSQGRRVKCFKFSPPRETGHYTVRVSLGGSTRDRTRFGVWYDRGSCPSPAVRPRPQPPRPLPPRPQPPEPPEAEGLARSLAVTLRATWTCDRDRPDSIRVTVRNTHRSRSIPVAGISSRGLPGIGGFQCSSGGQSLEPGQTAVFEARGHLTSGDHAAEVWVTNLPAARDGARLQVRCGPDWEDLK
jgi:hypothetical protein